MTIKSGKPEVRKQETTTITKLIFRFLQIFEALVEAGAHQTFLSREDHLLLHDACGKGLTSVARSLCEMGADVRVRGPFKNTCLHLAAEQGHYDTVRTLVDECEADVNAENLLDKKPLHLAAVPGTR